MQTNRYDQVVDLLCNHWITAVLLLLLVVIMAIPQVRDGLQAIGSFAGRFLRRSKSDTEPVVLKTPEETVTFTEMLRSIRYDIVKVHAHTHMLGVAAEYEWMRRRYPKAERISQALTTLDLISGKAGYKGDQIHFDRIELKLADGRTKEIYFDISDFFGGHGGALLDPQGQLAKKIVDLYKSHP